MTAPLLSLPLPLFQPLPDERGVDGDLVVASEVEGQVAGKDQVIVMLHHHCVDIGAQLAVLRGDRGRG